MNKDKRFNTCAAAEQPWDPMDYPGFDVVTGTFPLVSYTPPPSVEADAAVCVMATYDSAQVSDVPLMASDVEALVEELE